MDVFRGAACVIIIVSTREWTALDLVWLSYPKPQVAGLAVVRNASFCGMDNVLNAPYTLLEGCIYGGNKSVCVP